MWPRLQSHHAHRGCNPACLPEAATPRACRRAAARARSARAAHRHARPRPPAGGRGPVARAGHAPLRQGAPAPIAPRRARAERRAPTLQPCAPWLQPCVTTRLQPLAPRLQPMGPVCCPLSGLQPHARRLLPSVWAAAPCAQAAALPHASPGLLRARGEPALPRRRRVRRLVHDARGCLSAHQRAQTAAPRTGRAGPHAAAVARTARASRRCQRGRGG